MNLLTIDPGEDFGTAWFEGRDLAWCGFRAYPQIKGPYRILSEIPEIYERGKARPKDMITLAFTAGRIAERACKPGLVEVDTIIPKKWKKNGDPDALLVTIVGALTTAERRVYFTAADAITARYRHNVIDAIGIGLWKLQRLPL